ncbi:HepT-like ribonuclease domain-containing protein [Marinobacter sp. OP 3.4]|uniref:HepT-like ribonuclease domain-containing protein n=1 Tax=Marinobacter sp. OP 3.4 TaxID=3076501 RepID=UPI002E21F677
MQTEALKYLYDIREAALKIQCFTANKDEQDYLNDELLQSATERQFEIIGEALNKLCKAFPEVGESIPDYQKMIGFRNMLIHGYAVVDPVIV